MYLVAIGWVYVVLMMAVVEASTGTLLGAIVTFVLYGVMPLALVMYLLATPSRRAAKRAAELAARQAAMPVSVVAPHGGDHPAGDAVAPVREEA
jgi:hypothetical protein